MKAIAEIIEGHPLIHANPSDNVRDVARLMSDRNIGAIAVLEAGRLVGVFSERDIMARVVAAGLDPDATPVSTVMSKQLVVAEADDDVNDALQKMHEQKCRHLPVVRSGKLIGMLSIRDLLQVDDENNRQRASFLNELVTYSPDYES
jgi:CBS domain-containing protein